MRAFPRSIAVVLIAAAPSAVRAQTTAERLPPSDLLLNYDRVHVGRNEGIESGAFAARAADGASVLYNPAGLANVENFSVDITTYTYEATWVGLSGPSGSRRQLSFNGLPGFFGIVLGPPLLHAGKWRLGLAITTTRSWQPRFDTPFQVSQGDGSASFNFGSYVSLNTTLPGVAIAYSLGPNLRLGFGVAAAVTTLQENVTLTGIPTTAAGSGLVRNLRIDATTWYGLLEAGVQWEVANGLILGFLAKSPGVRLYGKGVFSFVEQQSTAGSASFTSMYDQSARYFFPLPFQANLGLAYRGGWGEVEADVRFHAGTHTGSLVESDQPVLSFAGGVQTQEPFPPVLLRTRPVANVQVGGHVIVSKITRLHAGFFTDTSPVATDTAPVLFPQVNLWGVSAGASFDGERLSASLGLAFTWGESRSFSLATDVPSGPIQAKLMVDTLTALVSFSYRG